MGAGVIQSEGGGSRRRRRGRKRPMSEINVTPFVDVMLVLLIIFMVAAPLLTVGVEVDMPDTAAQPLPNEQEEPLAVTMTADGRVMIMETEIAPEQIVPRLQSILAERTSNKIFIRADGALPYGNVAELMGALNAAGLTNLVFVTDAGGPRFGGQSE
jgi:biopolymer transport protein TolR